MNSENNTPISSNDSDNKPKWLARKIYETDAEKKRDFWIGVGIFFVLNIALALCQWGLFAVSLEFTVPGSDSVSSTLASVLYLVFTLAPWVINIGLIVFFAFTRSQIALGMVAGFGIALFLVICLGVIFMVWCFATLSLGSY